jgi:hypothetical protein
MALRQVLRLCTFNAENLNAAGLFFFGRLGGNDLPYDAAELDEKTTWMASILREGRPDIIGFQEIFHIDALKIALDKTGAKYEVYCPDCEGEANVVDEPIPQTTETRRAAKGPYSAFATKLEILEQARIPDFPPGLDLRIDGPTREDPGAMPVMLAMKSFERPVLRVKVRLQNGHPCWVFVAHLKSKNPFFFDEENPKDPLSKTLATIRALVRRGAEAVALRALLLEKLRGTTDPVVLLGDLNDDLPAVTTQAIAGDNPSFAPSAERPALFDIFLHSVHDIQDRQSYRDVSYSHIFGGRYELFDHIFVSDEFVRASSRVGRVLNTRIFNDHIFDTRFAAFEVGPRRRTRSDHGVPVTEVLLELPPSP